MSYCFDLYELGVNYRISRTRDKLNQLALLWQFGRFALGPAGDTEKEAEAEAEALAQEEDEGTVGQGALFRAASRVFRRVRFALAALAAGVVDFAYHTVLFCFTGPSWGSTARAEEKEGSPTLEPDGAVKFLLRFKAFLHRTTNDEEDDCCSDGSTGKADALADAASAEGRRSARFARLQEHLEATHDAMRKAPTEDAPVDLRQPPSPIRGGSADLPRPALSRLLSRKGSQLLVTKKTAEMVEERRRSEQALAHALTNGGRPARVYGWLRKLNSGQVRYRFPAPDPHPPKHP